MFKRYGFRLARPNQVSFFASARSGCKSVQTVPPDLAGCGIVRVSSVFYSGCSGRIAEHRSWGRVRINCVSGCPLTDAWCYEGTRLALSPQALRSPIIVAAIASAL